jgi:hypothetical protein
MPIGGWKLDDFAHCVRPSGPLVIQNRNFSALLAERDRWMELKNTARAKPSGCPSGSATSILTVC